MSVLPGTRLGPYEIGAKLGAGGRGEVWRIADDPATVRALGASQPVTVPSSWAGFPEPASAMPTP